MVVGQALLAANILPAAVAIPGAIVLAGAIALIASRLAAPPRAPGARRVDHTVKAEPLNRHRLIGQFINGFVHDLNNLLATALGGLELMERRTDDPERLLVLAKRSMEAIDKAANLTSTLARFARREQLPPQPTDVNALLADLQPLIACMLGRRIRLVIELERGLCNAHADAAALEAALLDICHAARAALDGGGQIAFATRGVVEMPSITVSGLSIVVTIEGTRAELAELDLGNARLAAAAAGAAFHLARRDGGEPAGLVREIWLVLTRAA